MKLSIHPIGLGVSECYLIGSEGSMLVDAGAPNKAKDILKALERLAVEAEEIQFLLITHGHWDHIGSATEIKETTGAKIAMHQAEKDWLEKLEMLRIALRAR